MNDVRGRPAATVDSPWAADFERDEAVWINSARHGPFPRIAAAAAERAIGWKVHPETLPDDAVYELPVRLKRGLATVVGADPAEIVLGNSTSYGLQTVANALSWEAGDEVLVVAGDFPATVYPWRVLEREGVVVRFITPRGSGLEPDDLAAALGPRTRLLCTNWVNSFTGFAADIEAIGTLCRDAGVLFVVNGAQAVGARPIAVHDLPIDALASCGHKWLCGPYGTGFLWLSPALLARMHPTHAYYVPMQAGRGLVTMRDYALRDDLGAAAFDVMGSGHHLTFAPWAAAVEYVASQGVAAIAAHDQARVERLAAGLEAAGYRLVSPRAGPRRATLVVASHREPGRNAEIARTLAEARIFVSLREGNLRLSPHLNNTPADVERVLEVLDGV